MRTLTKITIFGVFLFSLSLQAQNTRTTITPAAGESTVSSYIDKEVIKCFGKLCNPT